jgi:hypothetical protein
MFKGVCFCIILSVFICSSAFAQQKAQPDSGFKSSGKLWGLAFGDYYFKIHSDPYNRGGANQYTGIEKGRNAFQIRRIYLGYTYDISPKFTAETLLASEESLTTPIGVPAGDLLGNNKLAFYVKLANLRWKNVWKGTDFVIGQVSTPAFSLVTEPIWGYRAVERTVADIRRTPSFDLGASFQGKFDANANFGYNLMVGNGTSARPEDNKFKRFYADVFAKFLDKRLVFDLYADYERLNRTASWHHSQNMIKGFVAYTTPSFTAGLEAFVDRRRQDIIGVNGLQHDTISSKARAISGYIRGTVVKDKVAFFTRVDSYNPDLDYDGSRYASYKGLTENYEPNNRELFFTAGLDFTPHKSVHFIPNIWFNRYTSNRSGLSGAANRDYDLVYRITFYYVYR